MESVIPSALANLLRTTLPSAPTRKHDIENVSDSSSEESLMDSSSQQVIEPAGPATCGRISGKQVADSPDSSGETLQMASSPSGPHAVNIDELSAAAERKLLQLPPLSSECCIYIVPDRMRYSNQRHYTPRVVSIGPIHYHNKKLKANEHLKERYFAEFRQHTGVSLKKCYELILNQERILRNCYADVIELNSENFVKMVMMDAAFLLMILVYNRFSSLLSSSDKIYKKPQMIFEIMFDMLLLENQLPFFILEDLYKLSKLQNILDRVGKFTLNFSEETAMTSLGHQFCTMFSMTKIPREQPCPNAVHILDMLRSYLIPPDWTPKRKKSQTTSIPSTKELHQAGVKIHVGSKENLFDIRFKNGILEVPPLVIEDSAELIFRNILAFELCHYSEHIFSDYFAMMRLLTLSSEDTELLIQKGVIDNMLPNVQRVSTLFQKLDSGNIIHWEQFLYSDVIKELNDYYEIDWHKWKATWYQKHFKAPWAICSFSAAVLLLALTIVQTVLTILQLVLPK